MGRATDTRSSAYALMPALYSDVPSELLQLVLLYVVIPRKSHRMQVPHIVVKQTTGLLIRTSANESTR